ncbi:MAG: DUF433 domain-containing protein [Acidobacteria bacterium]|nr:DUF433 domain-containing protein [Acidobacteriota bacterium]
MVVTKFKSHDGRDPREIPAYMLFEVARYTGVPFETLKGWTSVRKYSVGKTNRHAKPLIIRPEDPSRLFSFTNLIEAHVLNAIRRKHSIPMPRVRKALDYLSTQFDSKHPLAEHDFETDGVDLFVEKLGDLINVSQHGQLAMKEVFEMYLQRIERDEAGLAKQLFPFTRTAQHANDPRIVAINPRIAFGKPVITGTGIPTAIVAERYKTGESISEIADDYRRNPSEIEEAIRCEFELKAA